MRQMLFPFCVVLLLAASVVGQARRLWVLRAPGEMAEYDPLTFVPKEKVRVPPEALQSPQSLSVNHVGQMLFATAVPLPLSESDAEAPRKAWVWDGKAATTIDQGVTRKATEQGSNIAIEEAAPEPRLSADGSHLFWFASEARRLQREDVDLSTTNSWQAWQSGLSAAGREDLTSSKLPACRCKSGACDDDCAYPATWSPEGGIGGVFVLTQVVSGQTETAYKNSAIYQKKDGKWTATDQTPALQRVLDASSDGGIVVEAIPDTGCCGWSNRSNDQALVLAHGNPLTIFDEQATYKNPNYDVSFFTANAHLSPDASRVAFTIVGTAKPNKPIQLAEDGQASPEESQRIRKALAELPAVEVKSLGDSPKRVAYLPHATLVGWLSDQEILLVEDHLLVAHNIVTGARRKSTIRVEEADHVFLR